ncbi:hypothetical protein CPT_Moabite_215 [Serratia phage Moabite]|uniref:Uncharacterized protein n=3 Tax=Moabitevirus TaxID=2843422 RepID=A0A7T3NC55_9CAUD|nr:hypothetical protein HWB23_gp140 [Serratia phage vB_SmaM_ 2050HW]YP_009849309.1 hypothetical protein HWC48_gp201 [Serratia phage Moabite]QPX76937.1 hypothetical protein [Serratia phage vB_SmaM_Yaphecito]UCR74741.1 hypothetical protein [Serratia phage BUCT660]UGO54099.1 hypothetical protein HAYMO_117 [Serratia phage vB_SmaM_Haymo]UQT03609.1 hypothetical protein KODAMA_01420 [Serratia phage vB_SmaM-Kodama]URG14001.1 hypothetical protein [Pectobacterium phage vB_ParM-25]
MKLMKSSFSGLVAQARAEFNCLNDNKDREDYLHLLEGKLSRFTWSHFGEKEFTNPKNKIRARRIAYLSKVFLYELVLLAIKKDPNRIALVTYSRHIRRDANAAWVRYEAAINTNQGSWWQQIKFYFDARKFNSL